MKNILGILILPFALMIIILILVAAQVKRNALEWVLEDNDANI